MSASLRVALLLLCLLSQAVEPVSARGVLSIKLLSFENRPGRTYEGQCCDPTPQDGDTCQDQCDYVMRLIISGLGRANDHVFLFHRPLKYDSNDLHFQEHSRDLTLTVLFDRWPEEGHVKMNAFFYDYDDFDHTTELVDWFETELSGQGQMKKDGQHELLVSGNRQNEKTSLKFEWSRLCDPGNPEGEGEDCNNQPLKDQQSWPWAEADDTETPEQHGRVSSKVNSQVYYHNEKSKDGYLKSPFKPFSTRRHNTGSDQSTTSYTPNPLHSEDQSKVSKPLEVDEVQRVNDINRKVDDSNYKADDVKNKSDSNRNRTSKVKSKTVIPSTKKHIQSPFKPFKTNNVVKDKVQLPEDELDTKDHSNFVNTTKETASKAISQGRLGSFPESNRSPFYKLAGLREIAPDGPRPRQTAEAKAAMASMEMYSNRFRNSRKQQTMRPPRLQDKPMQAPKDNKKHSKGSSHNNAKKQQKSHTLKPVQVPSNVKVDKQQKEKHAGQQLKTSPFKPTIKATGKQLQTKNKNLHTEPEDRRKPTAPGGKRTDQEQTRIQLDDKPAENSMSAWIMQAKDVSTISQKTKNYAKPASSHKKSVLFKKDSDKSQEKPAAAKARVKPESQNNITTSTHRKSNATKTASTAAKESMMEHLLHFRPVFLPSTASSHSLNSGHSTKTTPFSASTTPARPRPVIKKTDTDSTGHSTTPTRTLITSPANERTTGRRGWGPLHKNRFVTWIPATPAAHWAPRSKFQLPRPNTKKLSPDQKSSATSVPQATNNQSKRRDTNDQSLRHITNDNSKRQSTKEKTSTRSKNQSSRLSKQGPFANRQQPRYPLLARNTATVLLPPHDVQTNKIQVQSQTAVNEAKGKEKTLRNKFEAKPQVKKHHPPSVTRKTIKMPGKSSEAEQRSKVKFAAFNQNVFNAHSELTSPFVEKQNKPQVMNKNAASSLGIVHLGTKENAKITEDNANSGNTTGNFNPIVVHKMQKEWLKEQKVAQLSTQFGQKGGSSKDEHPEDLGWENDAQGETKKSWKEAAKITRKDKRLRNTKADRQKITEPYKLVTAPKTLQEDQKASDEKPRVIAKVINVRGNNEPSSTESLTRKTNQIISAKATKPISRKQDKSQVLNPFRRYAHTTLAPSPSTKRTNKVKTISRSSIEKTKELSGLKNDVVKQSPFAQNVVPNMNKEISTLEKVVKPSTRKSIQVTEKPKSTQVKSPTPLDARKKHVSTAKKTGSVEGTIKSQFQSSFSKASSNKNNDDISDSKQNSNVTHQSQSVREKKSPFAPQLDEKLSHDAETFTVLSSNTMATKEVSKTNGAQKKKDVPSKSSTENIKHLKHVSSTDSSFLPNENTMMQSELAKANYETLTSFKSDKNSEKTYSGSSSPYVEKINLPSEINLPLENKSQLSLMSDKTSQLRSKEATRDQSPKSASLFFSTKRVTKPEKLKHHQTKEAETSHNDSLQMPPSSTAQTTNPPSTTEVRSMTKVQSEYQSTMRPSGSAETNSVREESMKRIRTQTFGTPTAVMWYVTAHPAYVKTKAPSAIPPPTNIDIKVPNDITIEGTVHIDPDSTVVNDEEKKYKLPVLPYSDPNVKSYKKIAVEEVVKKEKTEVKKTRKYRLGKLKSRLELIAHKRETSDASDDNSKQGHMQTTRTDVPSPKGSPSAEKVKDGAIGDELDENNKAEAGEMKTDTSPNGEGRRQHIILKPTAETKTDTGKTNVKLNADDANPLDKKTAVASTASRRSIKPTKMTIPPSASQPDNHASASPRKRTKGQQKLDKNVHFGKAKQSVRVSFEKLFAQLQENSNKLFKKKNTANNTTVLPKKGSMVVQIKTNSGKSIKPLPTQTVTASSSESSSKPKKSKTFSQRNAINKASSVDNHIAHSQNLRLNQPHENAFTPSTTDHPSKLDSGIINPFQKTKLNTVGQENVFERNGARGHLRTMNSKIETAGQPSKPHTIPNNSFQNTGVYNPRKSGVKTKDGTLPHRPSMKASAKERGQRRPVLHDAPLDLSTIPQIPTSIQSPPQNPVFRENTQTQASIVLLQPKGRVSSLYTSDTNGKVVDPSLLNKKRDTAVPRISDKPRGYENHQGRQQAYLKSLFSKANTEPMVNYLKKTKKVVSETLSRKVDSVERTAQKVTKNTEMPSTEIPTFSSTSTKSLNITSKKPHKKRKIVQERKQNKSRKDEKYSTTNISSTPEASTTKRAQVFTSSNKQSVLATNTASAEQTIASTSFLPLLTTTTSPRPKTSSQNVSNQSVKTNRDALMATEENVHSFADKDTTTPFTSIERSKSTLKVTTASESSIDSSVAKLSHSTTSSSFRSSTPMTTRTSKTSRKTKGTTVGANSHTVSPASLEMSHTTNKITFSASAGATPSVRTTRPTSAKRKQESTASTSEETTTSSGPDIVTIEKSTSHKATTILNHLRSKIGENLNTSLSMIVTDVPMQKSPSGEKELANLSILTTPTLAEVKKTTMGLSTTTKTTQTKEVRRSRVPGQISTRKTPMFTEKANAFMTVTASKEVVPLEAPEVKHNPLLSLFANLSVIISKTLKKSKESKHETSIALKDFEITFNTTDVHDNATQSIISTSTIKSRPKSNLSVIPSLSTNVSVSTVVPQRKTPTAESANSSSDTSGFAAPATFAKNTNAAFQTKETRSAIASATQSSTVALTTSASVELNPTNSESTVTHAVKNTDTTLLMGETTTPKKIMLTLPGWLTFPNKFKNMIRKIEKATKSPKATTLKTTVLETSTSVAVSSTRAVPTTTYKPKSKSTVKSRKETLTQKTTTQSITTEATTTVSLSKTERMKETSGIVLNNLLPKDLLSKINGQRNSKDKTAKGLDKNPSRYATKSLDKDAAKTEEQNQVKKARLGEKNQQAKRVRFLATLPSFKDLQNSSESGPKVMVPKKGLFVPRFIHYDRNGTHHAPEVTGSEARHVSMRMQQLSVGTVFSRYWPAILGLTVGTVFLVVALLTSIACRQQRLFVQRRQGWQQDTPQHLTEPPDTSEYSSSASSLASDNTRSSINFT